MRATYYKFFSKHKTFTAHFSLFSSTPVCHGTQFGKYCSRKSIKDSKSWDFSL